MGRVFSAHDSRLNKRVAIKLLPASSDKSNAVLRFQVEAKAVSKLNNKHIVQVMDFGFTESGGEPFLVMEFIEGKDLDSIIETSGALPPRTAVEIAHQVAIALDHAHSNNVVHRDLKPGNIVIDGENCARVLDFGLAKILTPDDAEDWKLTKPGQPVGSVLFMSPEQFEGREAGELSEVYALGLVLFNALTGTIPHQGENLMALMRKRRTEAPPVLPVVSDEDVLQAALTRIIETALATAPEHRYQSMAEFRDALANCIESQTVETEIPAVEEISHGKPPLGAIAGSILLLLLVIMSAATLFPADKPSHRKPQVKRERPLHLASGGLPPGFKRVVDEKIEWWQSEQNLPGAALTNLIGSDVRNLSLEGNQEITDADIHSIRDLKLNALKLRDTRITDQSIDDINNFKLVALNLRSTKITENGILKLTENPRLIDLDVKYLKFSDPGLNHIARVFPNLQNLNIGFTQVNRNGQHLSVLKKLPNLQKLYAEQIDITDRDVDTLVGLKLQSLELAANPITTASVVKILTLPQADFISLAGCKGISEADVARLKERFPSATIVAPVHDKTSVEPEVMQLFKESAP